jgi:ribokinase
VSTKRVIVIGDVMLDVVVRPTRPMAPTSDTPSSVRLGRGGSGANMAVAIARCGHDVVYVGAAGDDVAARTFHDDLAGAGVRAELETVELTTGVVVALVASDGQRAMLTDRGANRALSAAHVLVSLRGSFDHLHVSGYIILDDATREVGVAALRMARKRGASTSVDVCSLGPLLDVTPQVFLEAVRDSTMLFANEEEALAVTGAKGVEEALVELSHFFEEVVITRGVSGATARIKSEVFSVPSVSSAVLDTTGAGDAATGTYLGTRLQGRSVLEGLEEAMRASANVVTGLGSLG